MIWLTIILALLFWGFYNYILSEFVHFMNTIILVPVQRFINEAIKAINKIINKAINAPIAGINTPFKGLHNLSIKASLGKVFGKDLGFELKPFTFIPERVVPDKLVPNVPKLPVKCIPEPPGYEDVFGFNRPRECEKKGKKDKPKASILSDGALKYYILFLILCLLMLMVFIYNSKEDAGLTGTGVETASSVAKLDGLSVDGLPDALGGANMLGAVGASSVATVLGAPDGLGAVPDVLGTSSVATGANGATMLGAASSVATGVSAATMLGAASSVATGVSAATMLGAASSVATGANGGLPGASAAASSASAAWL
jgi:hypothetical protein